MPARDIFHSAVRRALESDGWTITDDPLRIEFGRDEMAIDLGAERIIAAQKGTSKIAVEVKTFAGASLLYEFHLAVGQYRNYGRALRVKQPDRVLYLAVSTDVYNSFLQSDLMRLAIEEDNIKLLVFHAEQEVVIAWIN